MKTEKRLAYLKEYRKRPDVRERQAKRFKKWYETKGKFRSRKSDYADVIIMYEEKYPDRVRAMELLHYAVRIGKLTKPAQCEICKKERYMHAHHKDYTKALDVLWVCASCHKRIHLGIIKI